MPPLDTYRQTLAVLEAECRENRREWPIADAVARAAVIVPLRRLIALLEVKTGAAPQEALERADSAVRNRKATSACVCGAEASDRAHSTDPWCPALDGPVDVGQLLSAVTVSAEEHAELFPVSENVAGATVIDMREALRRALAQRGGR